MRQSGKRGVKVMSNEHIRGVEVYAGLNHNKKRRDFRLASLPEEDTVVEESFYDQATMMRELMAEDDVTVLLNIINNKFSHSFSLPTAEELVFEFSNSTIKSASIYS